VQFGFETEKMTYKGCGEEDEDDEDEITEITEGDTLIPKPNGEPGRPHCGGYSLDDSVLTPWGGEMLAKVTASQFPSPISL